LGAVVHVCCSEERLHERIKRRAVGVALGTGGIVLIVTVGAALYSFVKSLL